MNKYTNGSICEDSIFSDTESEECKHLVLDIIPANIKYLSITNGNGLNVFQMLFLEYAASVNTKKHIAKFICRCLGISSIEDYSSVSKFDKTVISDLIKSSIDGSVYSIKSNIDTVL